MPLKPIRVMKFGGTSLAGADRLSGPRRPGWWRRIS